MSPFCELCDEPLTDEEIQDHTDLICFSCMAEDADETSDEDETE